jgi:outer membrane receptor protein involved in Fe transport
MQGLLRAKGFNVPGDRFDGQNYDLSALFGANSPDGKGNVTAYFQYHYQAPVSQGERDFSACKLNAGLAAASGVCSGSANSNQWIPLSGPNAGGAFSIVGTSLLPYPQANSVPPALFNSSPYQYLSRGDERYTGGFEAHYDLIPAVQFYSEFSFMNDRSKVQIAPSGLFEGGNVYSASGSGGVLINCDNPLLSAQEYGVLGCTPGAMPVDTIIGRRNVEGGPRSSYYEHMNYRGVIGVKGDVGDGWHYDVYASYYYTSLYQSNNGYLSIARTNNALNVVNVNGVPTCQSVVNGTDLACVPYNIFSDGGVTPEALKYLTEVGTEYGTVSEQIVEGDITGDLGRYGLTSPWANEGVGISFGTSYRRDALDFVPDAVVGSGDLSGGSGVGSAIDAAVDVKEVYGELRAPLVEKKPWVESLELEAGVRYSKYSTGPDPLTYKVLLAYSPIPDVRFRASYQHAVRAPNIIELYNPAIVTQSNAFANADPCAGPTPLLTAAQCALTGVTASQYGNILQCPAGQCNVSTGGNVALKPETSDTYSIGATFTPSFAKGLVASVDYWEIDQHGLIGTLQPDTILAQCVASGSSTSDLCQLIHRSSIGALFGPSSLTTGGYVVGTSVNIAAGVTSGIDIQAAYRLDLDEVGAKDMGSITWDLTGTYLLMNTTTDPGVPTFDCAGLFGTKCQTVNPRWRHNLRMTWHTPWNLLASIQWRLIGGAGLDTNSSQAGLTNGVTNVFSGKLPTVNYMDLSFVYTVKSGIKLRAGINNVLDQDPPIISSLITGTGTPNSYPTYDLLGREMFIGVTADF